MDEFVEEHISIFRCGFDFKDMPFDTQTCTLHIELPTVDNDIVKLKWGYRPISTAKLTNVQWLIDQGPDWKVRLEETSREKPWGQSVPGTTSNALVVEFRMTRLPESLIKNYVIPSVCFWLVSWVGLFIDIGAVPARTAIGIIPVLIMANKLSAFAGETPPISYYTRMDQFLLMNLVMICLHMLDFVVTHAAEKRVKELAAGVMNPQQGCGTSEDQAPRSIDTYKVWAVLVDRIPQITKLVSLCCYVLLCILTLSGAAVS